MKKNEFIKNINDAYRSNSKLEAVRLIKNFSGQYLKESKDIADELFHKDGNEMPGIRIYKYLKIKNLIK